MRIATLLGLLSLLAVSGPAWGAWAYIPPQALVDQADYVVLGTLVDVNKETGQAAIKVEQLLKGAAIEKIPVRWLAERPEGPAPGRDKFYAEGTRAIWLLGRPEKNGRYSIDHPGRNMGPERLDRVKAMVADFQSIKWGKPVNGLAAAVRAHRSRAVDNSFELFLAVKNVSDRAITVQTLGGEVKLSFTLTGTDRASQTQVTPPADFTPRRETVTLEKGQAVYVGWQTGLNSGTLKPGVKWLVTGRCTIGPAKPGEETWVGELQTEPLEIEGPRENWTGDP